MNLPGHRIVGWLGKAALKTHALQTLRDCRASPKRAKRLECVRFIGAFRRARDGPRFMVPMQGRKAEGALYEPTHARPLPGGELAFVCVVSVPLLGGVGSWPQCAPKMASGPSARRVRLEGKLLFPSGRADV